MTAANGPAGALDAGAQRGADALRRITESAPNVTGSIRWTPERLTASTADLEQVATVLEGLRAMLDEPTPAELADSGKLDPSGQAAPE